MQSSKMVRASTLIGAVSFALDVKRSHASLWEIPTPARSRYVRWYMRTAQWVKKLGGHAGELYVSAELSKRGIPNALLPENFSDDDILAGNKSGSELCYIQVKACHPDRGKTFPLYAKHEAWVSARENEFVVFVWLGSPAKNEGPKYWIASK